MNKIMYRLKLNDQLLADCFLAEKNQGTVILMAGMPSYLHKTDYAKLLCDSGFNVLQPFYYGSWASFGDFSVQNCLKTVEDTIESLKKQKAVSLYDNSDIILNNEYIILAGMSFGSSIIQSLGSYQDIEKVILISSIPGLKRTTNGEFGFDAKHFTNFMKNGYGNCYRSDNWDKFEIEINSEAGDLSKFNIPKKIPILVLQGDKDYSKIEIMKKHLDLNKANYNAIEILNSYHGFDGSNQEEFAKHSINFLCLK